MSLRLCKRGFSASHLLMPIIIVKGDILVFTNPGEMGPMRSQPSSVSTCYFLNKICSDQRVPEFTDYGKGNDDCRLNIR